MKRNLFVSFTETMRGMARGVITKKDFDDALFYFGCTQSHGMNPWKFPGDPSANEVLWAFKNKAKGKAAHRIFVRAVTKAQKEGRVKWRKLNEEQSFAILNALLRQNGIKPLDPRYRYQNYDYGTVQEAFKLARIPRHIVVIRCHP